MEKKDEQRKRLKNLSIGDLVWEFVPREVELDYHPAVVKRVDIEGSCVEVIDVSSPNNPIKNYNNFLTKSGMLATGFREEDLQENYKKYQTIIDEVIKGKR